MTDDTCNNTVLFVDYSDGLIWREKEVPSTPWIHYFKKIQVYFHAEYSCNWQHKQLVSILYQLNVSRLDKHLSCTSYTITFVD